jgi:hypothetical protein
MSIHDEINHQRANEALTPLLPSVPGDSVERHMFISREIRALLDGPWPSRASEVRCGKLRAELETFVVGHQMNVCLRPYEAQEADMGRLDRPADEVWDFRACESPGLRVFGRFADLDVFIALTCWPRSVGIPWIDRPFLGARDSQEWKDAITECKFEWRKMFFNYQPISGEDVHDYISENVISF